MVSSIQAGFKWVTIAQDIYEQRLKKEYTDPSCVWDWEYKYQDPQKGTVTIQRPNHGLAHTLRCAAYVPLVASAYARFQNTAILPSEDIENIQLALLFYVAGRENDAGGQQDPQLKFRAKSAEIFEKYARANLNLHLTNDKIVFFQQVLTDSCNPHDLRYVQYIITRISHNIDLARCIDRKGYEKNILKSGLLKNIGDTESKQLVAITEECLKQTGDRLYLEGGYNSKLFGRCSTNVYYCLGQIHKAIRATIQPLQLLAQVALHPTVGELHNLLCTLIEHAEIKTSAVSKIFDAKVGMLVVFPEETSLQPNDQKFYRLAKRTLREDGKVSPTVVELLVKDYSINLVGDSSANTVSLSQGMTQLALK